MMDGAAAEPREKKMVENLGKLVGREKLIGCRFKYRPVEQLGRIFVKVTGVTEGESGLELKNLETDESYSNVQPSNLSIGAKSRSQEDPLIALLRENGMEVSPFVKGPAQLSGWTAEVRTFPNEPEGERYGFLEGSGGDRVRDEAAAECRGLGACKPSIESRQEGDRDCFGERESSTLVS